MTDTDGVAEDGPGLPKNPSGSGGDSSKMKRGVKKALVWVVGVLSAVLIATLTGISGKVSDKFWSPDKPPALPASTDLRFYRPFAEDGRLSPRLKVVKTFDSGSCQYGWRSSDPDSLRCSIKNYQIMDPCWTSGAITVCPLNPWDVEVIVLNGGQMPSKSERPSVEFCQDCAKAWALEVVDPQNPRTTLRCVLISGATWSASYGRMNWECFDGSKNVGSGWGSLMQETSGPWKIHYVPEGGGEGRDILVKTLWR
ncbi:hypothetical protein ACIRRA_34020 [Nocardia sp. NPDC101769]|uniref:hypothetical protein n=1 Tax=Nocardia sp. NPDC101769 TaxID=3364333 RepID=UPI0038284E19